MSKKSSCSPSSIYMFLEEKKIKKTKLLTLKDSGFMLVRLYIGLPS